MKTHFKNLILRRQSSVSLVVLSMIQFLILPGAAQAMEITGPNGVLCQVAAYMFWILIALSSIMVLWGAFMYLTAGGEAEKVSKAHKTLAYAAAGIIVAMIAKAFPSVIAGIVGATIDSGSTC